jgi:hypothetical protein
MKRKRMLIGLALLGLLLLPAAFTERGDWLGPVERAARAALHGWDMWATEAVRPYEPPMPQVPDGAVPITGRWGYDQAAAAIERIPAERRAALGERSYARFCRQCHGPNGDGRAIVGESFDVALPDLRADAVRAKGERALYASVAYGTRNMLPLRDTVDPAELLLCVRHLDTLAHAPSEPYFVPQHATATK